MARFHSTSSGKRPFTAAEETARDAEETEAQNSKVPNAWKLIRNKRNKLLTDSDWTQASDSPLTDEVQASWATYRETLRNLPANTPDPDSPTWPTPPE